MVDDSNLYMVRKDRNKTTTITDADVHNYLGISIYISTVHVPNVRSIWSSRLGLIHNYFGIFIFMSLFTCLTSDYFEIVVQDEISERDYQNRFEAIQTIIHFIGHVNM